MIPHEVYISMHALGGLSQRDFACLFRARRNDAHHWCQLVGNDSMRARPCAQCLSGLGGMLRFELAARL